MLQQFTVREEQNASNSVLRDVGAALDKLTGASRIIQGPKGSGASGPPAAPESMRKSGPFGALVATLSPGSAPSTQSPEVITDAPRRSSVEDALAAARALAAFTPVVSPPRALGNGTHAAAKERSAGETPQEGTQIFVNKPETPIQKPESNEFSRDTCNAIVDRQQAADDVLCTEDSHIEQVLTVSDAQERADGKGCQQESEGEKTQVEHDANTAAIETELITVPLNKPSPRPALKTASSKVCFMLPLSPFAVYWLCLSIALISCRKYQLPWVCSSPATCLHNI